METTRGVSMTNEELADQLESLADGQDDDLGVLCAEAAERLRAVTAAGLDLNAVAEALKTFAYEDDDYLNEVEIAEDAEDEPRGTDAYLIRRAAEEYIKLARP